jgi:hypothetical protein
MTSILAPKSSLVEKLCAAAYSLDWGRQLGTIAPGSGTFDDAASIDDVVLRALVVLEGPSYRGREAPFDAATAGLTTSRLDRFSPTDHQGQAQDVGVVYSLGFIGRRPRLNCSYAVFIVKGTVT